MAHNLKPDAAWPFPRAENPPAARSEPAPAAERKSDHRSPERELADEQMKADRERSRASDPSRNG